MTAREVLFECLRDRPSPVLVFSEQVIPAASLWVVTRLWVDAFRTAGVTRGSTVAFSLTCDPAGIAAWLALVWEDAALVLPDHPRYATLEPRCEEPNGSFVPALDRLAPVTRAMPLAPSQSVAGAHGPDRFIGWDDLFAEKAHPVETVRLDAATWATLPGLSMLARALRSAEVIELVR